MAHAVPFLSTFPEAESWMFLNTFPEADAWSVSVLSATKKAVVCSAPRMRDIFYFQTADHGQTSLDSLSSSPPADPDWLDQVDFE